MTVDDLYGYVYDQVVKETPRQAPLKFTYKQQGDFVVALNRNPVVKPAELPKELRDSMESPVPWHRLGAVHQLDSWLLGTDPRRALAAREALQAMTNDDSRQVAGEAVKSLAPVLEEEERQKEEERRRAEEQRQQRLRAQAEQELLATQKAEEERSRAAEEQRQGQLRAQAEQELLATQKAEEEERSRRAEEQRQQRLRAQAEQELLATQADEERSRTAEEQRQRQLRAQAEQERLVEEERERELREVANRKPIGNAPPAAPDVPDEEVLVARWVQNLMWGSVALDSFLVFIGLMVFITVRDLLGATVWIALGAPGAILTALAIRQMKRDGGRKLGLPIVAAVLTCFTCAGVLLGIPIIVGLLRNPAPRR